MEFKIGEIAKMAGVNIQTVRYYEKCGLLQPSAKLESGYRLYDEDALKRLKFIRYAKRLGFTLKQADELLKLQADNTAKCEDVRHTAEKKISEINEKIEGLNHIQTVLMKMINTCRDGQTTKECPILESIANLKRSI